MPGVAELLDMMHTSHRLGGVWEGGHLLPLGNVLKMIPTDANCRKLHFLSQYTILKTTFFSQQSWSLVYMYITSPSTDKEINLLKQIKMRCDEMEVSCAFQQPTTGNHTIFDYFLAIL